MVALAERELSVGIVTAYRMGGVITSTRLACLSTSRTCPEACWRVLVDSLPRTGSQYTVLCRAVLVREQRPFLAPDAHVADSDANIELL